MHNQSSKVYYRDANSHLFIPKVWNWKYIWFVLNKETKSCKLNKEKLLLRNIFQVTFLDNKSKNRTQIGMENYQKISYRKRIEMQ